jgi:hypothetical protein
LLALKEIHGSHSGENMALLIFEVIKEFGFEDNIGYFVMDNADSNDKALEVLNELIQKEGGIGFDVKERRIHCLGHIINLVVKHLLFGQKAFNMDKNKERGKDKGKEKTLEAQLKEEAAEWRALGAVGQLHNIITWVRRTPQHREIWIDIQLQDLRKDDAFILSSDNNTRWSSTANMISAALKYKDNIKILCAAESDLKDDRLNDEQWKDLENVLQLLQPFKDLTLYAQGKNIPQGSIISVLPSIICLLGKLESAKKKCRSSEIGLKASIDLA